MAAALLCRLEFSSGDGTGRGIEAPEMDDAAKGRRVHVCFGVQEDTSFAAQLELFGQLQRHTAVIREDQPTRST
jgi:hypothetical protein